MNALKRPGSQPSVRRASGVRTAVPVRAQAAFVRALLDDVERTTTAEEASDPIGDQLVEELGRLGCRCMELAASLRSLVDEQERLRAEAHDAISRSRVA